MAEDKTVQSVVRAARLLRLLGQADQGARLSDLARAAGLAVSTTHRLLTTLEQQGFAQFDRDGALWHVGRAAYEAGAGYIRRRNYVAPALPLLRQLRDATRETVNLGLLDGSDLVTILQVESREITRAIAPPGGRVPVFSSAMGKAILACWPDDAIAAIARRTDFRPMTRHSHRDLASAMADIRQVRARGYAIDDEEHAPGLRCVAAVVWSPQGEPACAISVSAQAARVTPERTVTLGRQIIAAAGELTDRLGGVHDAWPSPGGA